MPGKIIPSAHATDAIELCRIDGAARPRWERRRMAYRTRSAFRLPRRYAPAGRHNRVRYWRATSRPRCAGMNVLACRVTVPVPASYRGAAVHFILL
jgi:hypothetical protein